MNSSSAVWPSSSFSAWGSLSPGTSTTIRSGPSRMIVGSRVPIASMRLRTTSVALSIALSIARSSPARVWVRMKRLPSTTWIVQSRCPVSPAPVVIGSSRSRAASTWDGSSSMNESRPPEAEKSPMRMRGSASRSAARTDSSIVSSRWRATWRGSASSIR